MEECCVNQMICSIVSLLIVGSLIYFSKKFSLMYQLFHKVDKESTSHGGELVASVLKAHGVKYIFTLVGGHISPILVAAEKIGIRIVDTRHEVTAVFAADAVARLSGTVGVAAVTAGPGVTNTVTAVKNAQMAESPVLIIGGAAATITKGKGALQDIDQLSLFKSLCKYTATVPTVRDIVPTLRRALQIAQSGTPGPVFVEFPIDSLYPYNLVQREVGVKGTPRTLSQKIVKWYLDFYINNLFAGAFESRDMSPLPLDIPFASEFKVQEGVKLVSKAKKPVIIIGSQATLPPTPAEKLRSSLESLGIPCFLGGMSRGLLGKNSSIQMRQQRKDALKEADLVILAGSVCDFRLSYGRVLNKKSKIIAINRNKAQLHKNAGVFWNPTLPVQADVGDYIVRLVGALKGYNCDKEWLQLLRERDVQKEKKNIELAEQPTDRHLNPLKVLHELENVLGDNSILVADGGDFVGSAAYILRPRGPLMWLDPGAFGTLGVGGGFALGAKLCRPDADVVIIYGDGSLGFSIAEFDTYNRLKLPVIAVVGNDACWMQISREQVPLFKSNVACELAFTDYHKAAEGLGGKGYLLKAEDKENISSIFKEAIELNRNGDSVLLNCLIGKTSFREGSISV